MTSDELMQPLIEHLRLVLGTMLDAPVGVVSGAMGPRAWRVPLGGDGGARAITLYFDEAGSVALAAAVRRQDSADAAAVREVLQEICHEAATAALGAQGGAGAATAGDPELVEWDGGTGAVAGLSCAALPVPLVMALSVDDKTAQPTPKPAPAPAAPRLPIETPPRLDVLLDIDLPLVVRFGFTDMPLKTLSRLAPGSLIDLSRAPDDPVELLVGGRVVARGEVVVVSGSYGIRILELVGEREGARAVEA